LGQQQIPVNREDNGEIIEYDAASGENHQSDQSLMIKFCERSNREFSHGTGKYPGIGRPLTGLFLQERCLHARHHVSKMWS
jgi:hypothetical protein